MTAIRIYGVRGMRWKQHRLVSVSFAPRDEPQSQWWRCVRVGCELQFPELPNAECEAGAG